MMNDLVIVFLHEEKGPNNVEFPLENANWSNHAIAFIKYHL